MMLFKTDQPRTIDRLIDYFGETRQLVTPSPPPPAQMRRRPGIEGEPAAA